MALVFLKKHWEKSPCSKPPTRWDWRLLSNTVKISKEKYDMTINRAPSS